MVHSEVSQTDIITLWYLITYGWKIYINTVFNTIRRIIFHQNMHIHQMSQKKVEEEDRGAVHFFDITVLQRVIDDI